MKWKGFRRSAQWMSQYYTDCKKVVRCVADGSYQTNEYMPDLISDNPSEGFEKTAFQFDLSGLGDALIFEGNVVNCIPVYIDSVDPEHLTVIKHRIEPYGALRIHKCHGGSVVNNVLNHSVDISNVTGMEFANNHLEFCGASLSIKQSNITVRDNFFEKNSKPCIVIDCGIRKHSVNLEYNADNNIVILSNNNFHLFNKSGRTPVWELSDYDIVIDAVGGRIPNNIRFTNNFRTQTNEDGMAFQTVGISLGLMQENSSIVPFEKFNDHSYILSYDGSLLRALELVESAKISNVEDPYIKVRSSRNIIDEKTIKGDIEQSDPNPNPEPAENTPWPYKYKAQIIFDKTRRIAYPEFDAHNHVAIVNGEENYNTFIPNIGIEMHFERQTVTSPRMNARYILRIVRTPYISPGDPSLDVNPKEAEYVEIPMCGCATLHDNHAHVNGYPWKHVEDVNNPFLSNTYSPESIEFVNGNVKCIGNTIPAKDIIDKWVDGDECKVFIDDETFISFILHKGKWARSY